jgi:hypothetical protein
MPGVLPRNEYATWLESDPHARSAETIWNPRFREILLRMGALDNDAVDRATYARCARCHDPSHGHADDKHRDRLSSHATLQAIQPQGIGCESCHGPSKQWLASHYQRGVQRNELTAAGMTPLKDLYARGQVCASCHVGSAENDMNHDMIAAGHPALRFELASYHDQLPKHWNATEERRATSDFQAKLWGAGQAATADASLRLLAGRAGRAQLERDNAIDGVTRQPWPEFSETSCFSCHQRYGRAKSAPSRWGDWNLAFASRMVQPSENELPRPNGSRDPLEQLKRLMSDRSTPDPGAVHAGCQDALRELSDSTNGFALPSKPAPTNRELLELLLRSWRPEPNWDQAVQHFLALVASDRSFQDEGRRRMDTEREPLGSEWYWESSVVQQRLNRLRGALAFDDNRDLPRVMVAETERLSSDSIDLNRVNDELRELTEAFHERQRQLDRWREGKRWQE